MDVFISYKSEEYDEASWVREKLERQGITCWMAPLSIPGGSSYAAEIPKAIKACHVFVLVLSEKTQTSKWVPRELDQAINASKVIMPFMIENCELRSDFYFYLTNVQRYEAYKNKAKTMERMIADIQTVLLPFRPPVMAEEPQTAVPPVPEPKASEPPVQAPPVSEKTAAKAKRPPWALLAAGAAVLVAVLLCVLLPNLFGNTSMPSERESWTVAGTELEADDYALTLSQVTVTEEDLETIAKMEELISITMTDCVLQAEDLGNLVSEELQMLELTRCGLTDAQLKTISFEESSLSEVCLNGNTALTDLSPLCVLGEQLTCLEIADVTVADPTVLTAFPKLRELCIDRTGITDLTPLTAMIRLEKLCARSSGLTSLNGLENTTLLYEVDLRENELADVSVLLKSAASMKKLYLSDNDLTGTLSVEGMEELTTLAVDRNTLSSIRGLAGCKKLTTLSAAANHLEIIEDQLPKYGKLSYLDLSHNRLSVLTVPSGVLDLSYTVSVDLSHNDLVSLVLPSEANYRELALQGNNSMYVQELETLEGSHIYLPWRNAAEVTRLEESGFMWVHLIGCPLDQQVSTEEALYGVEFLTTEDADAAVAEEVPEHLR